MMDHHKRRGGFAPGEKRQDGTRYGGRIRGMDGGPGRGVRHGRGRGGAFAMDDDGTSGFGRGGRGPGSGRGGPGGAMRRRMFNREELHLMVLALLNEGPQHGYQLMRAFEERSGGGYVPSPGVLYPLLAMIEEMGEVDSVVAEDGKRRQVALTDTGRAALETGKALADAALARLAALTPAADRADLAPVRRAMTNLKTALGERLHREGADADTTFAVAALLDEVTQKIERL